MNLDIIPNGAIKRVHVSQNDVGRTLTFELFNNSTSYTVPSGAVVKIQGTKPSGFGFSETCSANGNVATIDTTEAMTDESGNIQTELSISYGDVVIGTSNFVLAVEKNPHPDTTTDGSMETIIPELTLLVNEVKGYAEEIEGTYHAYGSPWVASTVAEMTDTDKIYVYVGSESGYTNGNWYYYNGSAWVSGGVYNAVAVQTDTTLSVSGMPADAKVVGDVANGNRVAFLNNINMLVSERVDGKFIFYSNGTFGENPNWSYYEYISVKEGATYYTNIPTLWLAYYDSTFTFVSGEIRTNQYSFTVPSNISYVRLSFERVATYRYNSTIPMLFTADDFVPYEVDTVFKRLNTNVKINDDNVSKYVTHGKNLFNKYNLTDGYYISYNTGFTLGIQASWTTCFDYIECEANQVYVVNNSDCIINEYDENKAFVAGHNFVGSSSLTFTTNANTKYLRVSCALSIIDSFQLEKGSVTSYQSFEYMFAHSNGHKLDIIVVDENGTGDCETITEAVNDASDGAIIYIKNGTYHEAVDARNKRLNFVGESKDGVVWEYENGDYAYPPLEIAKGTVKDITFYAIAQEKQSGAIAKSYAVHIDFNESIGEYLKFENVKFVNEDYQTIGIGLRQDFTLEFVDCEFVCKGNNNAFYCHDSQGQATNQNVILRNCTFKTAGIAYCVHLQSQEISGSEAYITFQRCIVVNESANNMIVMRLYNESIGGGNYLNSTDWHLTKESLLNTLTNMNYS